MARDQDDDDALNWDGDIHDPTHIDVGVPVDGDRAAPSAGSSAALIGYGILAGAYLLFSIGWIVASQRDSFSTSALLFAVLYQFGEFLAIAAPALWFGLVFVLTPGRRAAPRLGWLLIGLPLIAPWPYLLAVSAA